MKSLSLAAAMLALAAPAFAQHQPYTGMEARPVKALSEQQISDLKAGRGMGLALAAELNGYPGPIHVLELGGQLKLTDAQRVRMQALYEAMKAEAIPLGEKLIAEEAALDRSFSDKTITEERLAASTRAIGQTNAELRASHLKYHLLTAAELNEHQIRQYAMLRGYLGGQAPHPRQH